MRVWETPGIAGPVTGGDSAAVRLRRPSPAPCVSEGRGQTGMATLLSEKIYHSQSTRQLSQVPQPAAAEPGLEHSVTRLSDPAGDVRHARRPPCAHGLCRWLERIPMTGRWPTSHTALPAPTKTRMTHCHPKQTQPTDIHRLNQHKRPFFKNLYSAWLGIKSPVLGLVAGLCQGFISDDPT